ncbi:hypothetical protein AMTRI_Chr06g194330 [Amborella trichopoda]
MCFSAKQENSLNWSLSYSPQDSSNPNTPSRSNRYRSLPHYTNVGCGTHQMGSDAHSYVSLLHMVVDHLGPPV